MSEQSDRGTYQIGYGKPPERTRFRKGVSGNPKGRPKGAKSISSILSEMGRELVKVNSNGKTRHISKLEAVLLQLINKAANGDLKAIRELLAAHRLFVETEPEAETPEIPHERDSAVMKNIITRIRNTEVPNSPKSSTAPEGDEE